MDFTLLDVQVYCTYSTPRLQHPPLGLAAVGSIGKPPPSATLTSVKVALVCFCLVDPSAFRAGLRLGARAVEAAGEAACMYESDADTAPSGISPQPHAYLRSAHVRRRHVGTGGGGGKAVSGSPGGGHICIMTRKGEPPKRGKGPP